MRRFKSGLALHFFYDAGVAELADARDLKSRGHALSVRVQVPPPAPFNVLLFLICDFPGLEC